MMGKLIKDSNVSLYVCLSLFNGPHTAENGSLFNLIKSRCELCGFFISDSNKVTEEVLLSVVFLLF